MISNKRKYDIAEASKYIFNGIPRGEISGPKMLAQLTINRVEEYVKKTNRFGSHLEWSEEFQYMIDCIAVSIYQSRDKEVEIVHNGKVLSREECLIMLRKNGLELNNQIKPDTPIS